MFKFDYITKKDIKKHNSNWPQILLGGGSESGKTNALLNLISHEPDTDKTYLYIKDSYEIKDQLLIKKEKVHA